MHSTVGSRESTRKESAHAVLAIKMNGHVPYVVGRERREERA